MIAHDEVGRVALGWWGRRLDASTGAARALRARLRRASAIAAVLAHREVIELSDELGLRDPARLALLARALAAVEAHTDRRLPRAFGAGDPPPLSELRFQRLIRATAPEDLTLPLLRAMSIVKGRCDVAALARDLAFWSEPIRARWCFDYFGAAAPDALTDPAPEETDA